MQRNEKSRRDIVVIQQFFFPDISAVSQLLGDLLISLSQSKCWSFKVLCGTEVRPRVSGRLPKSLENVKIQRIPCPFWRFGTPIGQYLDMIVYHVGVFLHLLLKKKPDIIVCLTTPPLIGFTVALATLIRPTAFIHYIEDLYPELLLDSGLVRRPYVAKKLSLFNRVTFMAADQIIVIGKWMARKLYFNYNIPISRPAVVENWTSEIQFILPLQKKHYRIMYSGNLGFAHGFDHLHMFVQSWPETDTQFTFVGSGRRSGSIRRSLMSVPTANVEFIPYVSRSEHGTMLQSASAFLVAQSPNTVGDILPSKIYSYLAAGRPVIHFGTRSSEIGEILLSNDIGVVIELEEDVVPAIEWLLRLFNDRAEYCELCARTRSVYESTGGVDRAMHQFQKIFSDVIAK